MRKLLALVAALVISVGLAAAFSEAQPPAGEGGPPPKGKNKEKGDPKKKKGAHEPGDELSKAYDLLRRLRADSASAGQADERLRDWAGRAAGFYRAGLKALNADDHRVAREYGAAAHDLARAVDHARNAVRFDRPDPDLPPPSDDFGLEDTRERARRDLYHAFDRIGRLDEWNDVPDAAFYTKAARDLYSAARRDLEAGRDERGGEMARAAEAMTHVPEHLDRVRDNRDRPAPPDRPDPKGDRPDPKKHDRPDPKKHDRPDPKKHERPDPKGERHEPKNKDFEPANDLRSTLPPVLPPG